MCISLPVKKEKVIKLRYVYIITCSLTGKTLNRCGMYISSLVHQRKEVIKLRYVYVIKCSSKGKKL